MAETTAFKIAAWAANKAVDLAVAVGANNATATAVWYTTFAATTIATTIGPGLLAASMVDVPKPSQSRIPLRQPIAPRQSAFGRVRTSGPYMLFEEYDGDSYDVIAFHDGAIDAIESRLLHNDEVTVGSGTINDVSYSDVVTFAESGPQYENAIRWTETLGASAETAHASVTDIAEWSSAHRGDGVASIGLKCVGTKRERFAAVYPYGLPQPSVIYRAQACFDPRRGSQDASDSSTWEWSENPVLQLLTYLIRSSHGGMAFDYTRRIAPQVQAWKDAADICEQQISLKAGGTHDRFAGAGSYYHSTAPADVIRAIMASFDGWMMEAGDGSLIVKAGKYEAPTVTITDDHIVGYSWNRYRPDEEAVNELQANYVSPDHQYEEQAAEPWQDAADIAARGRVRSQPFDLPWVNHHARARRLCKRQMYKALKPRGWIETNLYGLQAIGERFIRVQNSELPSMSDVVCEVTGMQFHFARGAVRLEVVQVGSDIDDWDAATEEGDAPPTGTGATVVIPSAPTISSVDVLTDGGLRMQVNVTTPSQTYATFLVRYRQSLGGDPETFTEWKVESFLDPDTSGGTTPLITAVVPEGDFEVQTALVLATGYTTDWSSASDVTVTAAASPDIPSGGEGGTL